MLGRPARPRRGTRSARPSGSSSAPRRTAPSAARKSACAAGSLASSASRASTCGQLVVLAQLAQHALERAPAPAPRRRAATAPGGGSRRPCRVAQLVLVQRRQPHRQRALQGRVEGGLHAFGVDVGQPSPVAVGGGQPLERLARRVVGGVLGQRARPDAEGGLHVAPLDLLDPRDFGQQREAPGNPSSTAAATPAARRPRPTRRPRRAIGSSASTAGSR